MTHPSVASGRVGPLNQNSTNFPVAPSALVKQCTNLLVASGCVGPPMQSSTKSLVALSATAQK